LADAPNFGDLVGWSYDDADRSKRCGKDTPSQIAGVLKDVILIMKEPIPGILNSIFGECSLEQSLKPNALHGITVETRRAPLPVP
jgi:hypothetical protein